jgi:hypothetical protein
MATGEAHCRGNQPAVIVEHLLWAESERNLVERV